MRRYVSEFTFRLNNGDVQRGNMLNRMVSLSHRRCVEIISGIRN